MLADLAGEFALAGGDGDSRCQGERRRCAAEIRARGAARTPVRDRGARRGGDARARDSARPLWTRRDESRSDAGRVGRAGGPRDAPRGARRGAGRVRGRPACGGGRARGGCQLLAAGRVGARAREGSSGCLLAPAPQRWGWISHLLPSDRHLRSRIFLARVVFLELRTGQRERGGGSICMLTQTSEGKISIGAASIC